MLRSGENAQRNSAQKDLVTRCSKSDTQRVWRLYHGDFQHARLPLFVFMCFESEARD